MTIALLIGLVLLTLAHLNLRRHVIDNNNKIGQGFTIVSNRIVKLEGKVK